MNEVLIIIYTIILSLVGIENIYLLPILLLYSTVTNLLCAWLGVYLDYNAPSKANSDNELLHGNSNKLGVVIDGTTKLLLEIWLSLKILTRTNILLIAILDNLLFLIVLVGITNKLVRRNYDTN